MTDAVSISGSSATAPASSVARLAEWFTAGRGTNLRGNQTVRAAEKLRRQTWRVETAECGLGVGRIGEPEGADPAVAPALPHQPGEGVEAILGLLRYFVKRPPDLYRPRQS
jgi:hypothetical protein